MQKNLTRGSILTVKCINNDGYPCSLTDGKLYKGRVSQFNALAVYDNENDGAYIYDWNRFEIVKEGWDDADVAKESRADGNGNP